MNTEQQADVIEQIKHLILLVRGMYWLLNRNSVWCHALAVITDQELSNKLSWDSALMTRFFDEAVRQYGVR